MSHPYAPPPPEVVREIREFANRRLSPEEFDAWLDAPMDDFEREQIEGLSAWFMRRYPTPAERLAWARRAYATWSKAMPPGR